MKGILRRLGGALSVLWCSLLAAVAVAESPTVQMLVPGFEVRELPIELTNINSLKYRRDGKLYALAYSGDIWLLSDTDGDQLEDRKELFFESRGRLRGPIGMAVIPPEHPLLTAATGGESTASGVVVASKGKVSAILDTDGDGVADTERIIASGWKEIPQNVDAVGVAIDPSDGAIYFGLGTAAYNNAYLLDEAGVSHFDLSSERGTIQRIEPDLSSRSTLCTGVRFTIGMAFNADGDLLAYLLRQPPRMPADSPLPAPPPRARSEVSAVLKGSDPRFNTDSAPTPDIRPLRLLLVAGAKDHGPGEHDYPAWLEAWSELLAAAPGVSVDTAMEWPEPEQLLAVDTIVFYQKGAWNQQRAAAIDAHLARGGGLVYIHWAIEGGSEAPQFANRIGLASDAAHTRYRHGPLQLHFAADSRHPIARNFATVRLHDESYWSLQGDASGIRELASASESGHPRPLFWTVEPDRGRVFVSVPGHYSWTFDDPLYRILIFRGIAWSAGEPVDRFNPLVPLGASLQD